MKIKKLIAELKEIEKKYGNVQVKVTSHNFNSKAYDGGLEWEGVGVESTSKKVTAIVLFPKPEKKKKLKPIALKTLADLLSLVGIFVTVKQLRDHTQEELAEMEKWAVKTHLKASDNNVRVPPRPQTLPAPWTEEAGYVRQW